MIIATKRIDKLPKPIRTAVKDAYRLLLNTVIEVREVFMYYGIEMRVLKGRKYGSIAVITSEENQGYVANGVKHAVERELPRAMAEISSAVRPSFTLIEDSQYRVFGYRWLGDYTAEIIWVEPRYVMYDRIFNLKTVPFGTYFNTIYIHADARPQSDDTIDALFSDAKRWLRRSDYVRMDGEYAVTEDVAR